MENNYQRKKLSEVCEIISGTTPKTNIKEYWNGDLNWITPAEISEKEEIIYETERKITLLGAESCSLRKMPVGTVLFSSRAPIGKVAIAGTEMYCNQGFKNFICSDEIYNKYLFYFLKNNKEYLNSLGRGATFKEVSKSIISQVEISLPNLDEQKAICAKLDNITKQISLKYDELKKYDELVKSQFIEMFGDFEKNLKFSDVLIDDTKYGYKFDSSYYNIKGEVPIIDQSENYICGYTNLHVDKAPYKDVSIIFGDHTERFKYVDFEYYLGADGTKILKCKNKFNPYFVYWYMNINYLPCGGYSRHFKYLKELLFINPSIELQNQFADFVKHIDKLKFRKNITKLRNICYNIFNFEKFNMQREVKNG